MSLPHDCPPHSKVHRTHLHLLSKSTFCGQNSHQVCFVSTTIKQWNLICQQTALLNLSKRGSIFYSIKSHYQRLLVLPFYCSAPVDALNIWLVFLHLSLTTWAAFPVSNVALTLHVLLWTSDSWSKLSASGFPFGLHPNASPRIFCWPFWLLPLL